MFSISVLSPQAFASHDLLAMISPGSFDSFLIRSSGTNHPSLDGHFGACLDGSGFLAGFAFDTLFNMEELQDFKEICLHFSQFFCILWLETFHFCKVLSSHFVKGKPAARRGRKVMGLRDFAGRQAAEGYFPAAVFGFHPSRKEAYRSPGNSFLLFQIKIYDSLEEVF